MRLEDGTYKVFTIEAAGNLSSASRSSDWEKTL